MALSAHAWRRVQRQAGEPVRRAWPEAGPATRRTVAAIVAQTADGWRVLARQDLARRDRADLFLVGANGVTAVVGGPLDDGRAAVRHAEGDLLGYPGAAGSGAGGQRDPLRGGR